MSSNVTAEVKVALPRATVWEGLRDLTRAQLYVPGVTGIEITTPMREGIGASRRVFQKSGQPVDETVVAWTEGQGFRLRLHNGEEPPAPFAEAWFKYDIADSGPDGTLLRCTLEYTLPWGVVGRALDLLLFRSVAGGRMRAVAAAFKRHYETGEVTNTAYGGLVPA
ncbi:MAG: SRPBCC family protein [Rhizomicrobium sp.]